jgi:cytochrome c peroxidase
MKGNKWILLVVLLGGILALSRCQPDRKITEGLPPSSFTTPFPFVNPKGFPQAVIPPDNPTTVEGVRLGRFLFYEKKLSGNGLNSCGSCHFQEYAFSDIEAKSNIIGVETPRNAMPLFNLAWQEFFFWDGRSKTLEQQAAEPIVNPIELNNDWTTVISRLEATPMYAPLFEAAFGDAEINQDRITKAIAQFERTLISANSHYDSIKRMTAPSGIPSYTPFPDPLIEEGYQIFSSEVGDCFHCHGEIETSYLLGAFGKDATFKNNGLNAQWIGEIGRMGETGDSADLGKMKVPSLRNTVVYFGTGNTLSLSAPYMHDGSVADIDSLIEFYNFGGFPRTPESNTDPNMKARGVGRNWTPHQKDALKAFLGSLVDYKFLNDTSFSDPFAP